MDLYVHANVDFLEKTYESAKKRALEEFEDTRSGAVWELDGKIVDWAIEDNRIQLSVDSDFGYISIDFTPDSEMIEQLAAMLVKKFNKLKTILEAVR